ncbi:glycosyltransferase family 2 protein [Aequorivita echinoideorum]|uniref:Glycosyltransferase family 2 protein n=1 Tax=Aequorivita echinoideorum TaxID=1549647 RepID=A0ABS5S7P2_9FLAO|nr:glycosyltransferase family 2 protein [Aequorivita echinoideorum]MBT0608445.1 glycosyltransferase family 2 protein [Aequorivita echinoideorum]
MQNLVSIIIPTYNRAHLIAETLDSILAQTYTNWECIIVDDGSTDNTDAVVESYVRKDQRFQYHHRPKNRKKGANVCRNYGFELSKGEYINWLDDDDLIGVDKIKNQIAKLANNEFAISTCAWGRFTVIEDFDIKELNIYKNYDNGYELLEDYGQYDCFFPCHSFLISKDIIYEVGLWDESLTINQDGEFFSRVILAASKILYANNTNVKYRTHKNSRISKLSNLKKANDIVRSWKLIFRAIPNHYESKLSKYKSNSKKIIFNQLRYNGYKFIILKNSIFFKREIFNYIIKKINSNL